MEVLTSRRTWIAAAAVAVLLGACLFPTVARRHATPFDHSVHVTKEGLDCRICHLFAQEGRGPTIPGPQVCRVCHQKFDADKPPERRIDAFFDADARFRRSRDPALHEDLWFSHGNHAGPQGLECAVCHGDMAQARDLPPRVASKKTCMGCHTERSAPLQCDNCHKTIRQDKPPSTHDAAWVRHHGGVVRSRAEGSANQCSLCHVREASCASCHAQRQPRDHTFFFRNRGHGIAAGIDRSRCATCHETNSCDRCHQDTRPLSHSPAWGGTQQRHCVSCHLPLRGEGCATCHKSNPGHATATPLPAGHDPAMNCRQCHGAGAPLPHPDNGGACVACHR